MYIITVQTATIINCQKTEILLSLIMWCYTRGQTAESVADEVPGPDPQYCHSLPALSLYCHQTPSAAAWGEEC